MDIPINDRWLILAVKNVMKTPANELISKCFGQPGQYCPHLTFEIENGMYRVIKNKLTAEKTNLAEALQIIGLPHQETEEKDPFYLLR